MVSGGGRGGRGGGRVSGAGSPYARARVLSATEELERQRRASEATCIRGSYSYLRQGCKLLRAFERRGSRFYQDLQLPSSRGSTSRSSDSPLRHLSFTEASSSSASPPVPRLNLGDYGEDRDIAMLAAKLKHAAPALMEDQTYRDTDKKAEWLREQAAQDACYIELSDSE